MADLADLVGRLVDEAVARINVIGRKQVIVVSSAGSGAARRITYKTTATDTNRYTAAALDSYTSPAANDLVWLDTFGGDSLIIGRVG